jgi:hypothetical protein
MDHLVDDSRASGPYNERERENDTMDGITNATGPADGPAQRLYILYLPLLKNNGAPQPAARFDWVEQKLLQLSEGLTWYPPGIGAWRPQPSAPVCQEPIVTVQAVTSSDPDIEAEFVRLRADIEREFEQDLVFLLSLPVWSQGTNPGARASLP